MKVGVLGTGEVGRALAGKLDELGHAVMVGTRDVGRLLAAGPGPWGQPPFSDWHRDHPRVAVGTFARAAAHGEMVINATAGAATLEALRAAGRENLAGKVLIDVANPLDFSAGMPPTLTVANTDSLGEQVQRAFPEARVVKALNTVNARLMVDPGAIGDGDHHVFVSGNDPEARAQVIALLRDGFGWSEVVDLGDITTARGTEMYLALWVRLMAALGTAAFNIRIVR
jgi:predicted dinucleotide-binding enzyme